MARRTGVPEAGFSIATEDRLREGSSKVPAEGVGSVRREPISKSCEITQADNLNRRRRLSRKAQ